jgi:hypothetical protein
MLFASGSGNAGPCRRLVAELVPAVRAVGSVALVCAAAACASPAANPYGALRPAGAAADRTDAPQSTGAAPGTAMGNPASTGPLGGMGEAVEGHRQGRW